MTGRFFYPVLVTLSWLVALVASFRAFELARRVASIDGSSDTPGTILVSKKVKQKPVNIRIKDSGCDIPEPIRGRISDPFFTTKQVGTAPVQGLAMAYSTVVDKHNGSLTIESEVGEGTTFAAIPSVDDQGLSEEALAA